LAKTFETQRKGGTRGKTVEEIVDVALFAVDVFKSVLSTRTRL
jgi:hypothetical protein